MVVLGMEIDQFYVEELIEWMSNGMPKPYVAARQETVWDLLQSGI